MKKMSFRLAAAAVSAIAVTSLGFAGLPAAHADGPAAANVALINPTASTTLSIHKYLGATTGNKNDGTAQTITGRDALQGVPFDVYLVQGVDLTTNAGWTAATALQGYKITATDIANGYVTVGGTKYTLAKQGTVVTDNTGTATFNGKVGLYLVNENLSAAGTITDINTGKQVPTNTITPSAPFFVTLPMTDPNNLNSWMYTVNVYPKNQADTITKTVADQNTLTVGGPISYGITTSIQALSDANGDGVVNGKDLGYYWVGDSNPYITATGVTVTVPGQTLTGCNGTTATSATGCDYFYWLDTDATAAGSQVQVKFTSTGLDKLAAAKQADPAAQVTTTISGTLLSVPTNGQVPNTATFVPSAGWWQGTAPNPDTPTPDNPTNPPTSNTVVSYFGNIPVTKVLVNKAAGDSPAGAQFAVYKATAGANSCTTADVSAPNTAIQSITTDASGLATFTNLEASNWYNNAAQTTIQGYCVVETKAPTGYNLNAQPFFVSIDYTTGTATAAPSAPLSVNDEKSNLGNSLPLTGGTGVAALSVVGLVLVGGGAAYYTMSGRRRKDQA